MRQWYVARTSPQREKFAFASLSFHGFSAYLPYRLYRVKGSPDRVELLFKSYILINFDAEFEPWQRINNLPGIDHLLPLKKELPEALPEGFVEELMKVEVSQDHVRRHPMCMDGVRKDDHVGVSEGPFMGMLGKFEGSLNGVASVLLPFFGRESAVSIPIQYLRPA